MSHVIRWGEWIAIAPILMVMMHSLDVQSAVDEKFLTISTAIQQASILIGFLSHWLALSKTSFFLCVLIQFACNLQIVYILLRSLRRYRAVHHLVTAAHGKKVDQSPLHSMISTKMRMKDELNASGGSGASKDGFEGETEEGLIEKEGHNDVLVAVKNVGIIIAFKLSIYCFLTWMLLLAVNTLGLTHLITHYQEAVLLSIVDVIDKCLYVRVLCSGHGTAVSPEGLLTRMLILEERANASIRLVISVQHCHFYSRCYMYSNY